MKSFTLALVGGLGAVLLVGRANAQEATDGLRQPAAIQQTAESHETALPLTPSGGTNSSTSDQQPAKASTSDTSTCYEGGFFSRFWQANVAAFQPKDDSAEDETPPPRRALPAPWASPPFPSGEYQGYPLIGVPPSESSYPLQKALTSGCYGDFFKDNRISIDGWVNASVNASNCQNSNSPSAYWLVPNEPELDQIVLRLSDRPTPCRPITSIGVFARWHCSARTTAIWSPGAGNRPAMSCC